ncbi:MAG: hypothetical protein E7328_04065 [Clostridiales bacterium]|nr:hypothetical protein [Clostridiales bacterium]
MNKTEKIITEYLKESKRIRRTLEFLPPSQEVDALKRAADFIDGTITDMGQKGSALTALYIHGLSWENASARLYISPNTLGRWKDSALSTLCGTLDAAGIDIRSFDPYIATPESRLRLKAAKRRAARKTKTDA